MSETLKKLDVMRSKIVFLDAIEEDIKNTKTVEEALQVLEGHRKMLKLGENGLRVQHRREIAQPQTLTVLSGRCGGTDAPLCTHRL